MSARPLLVETLETRVMPIVGSLAPAPLVPPGTNLDGVVQLFNSVNTGSGSELANQTEILTAAHVVNGGPPTLVIFNLQRAGIPIDIPLTVPANPAPPAVPVNPPGGTATANFMFPSGALAYNPAISSPSINDIAVVNLRDSEPLPADLPTNLHLIAPFSPYENGYAINAFNPAAAGALPQTFTMVGYGRQGTGANGWNALPPTFGQKTIGRNEYDLTQPAAPGAPGPLPAGANLPPGAVPTRVANPNFLENDFDGGGMNPFPGSSAGLGGANTATVAGVAGAPAPWLNEAGLAPGDSGGPGLIGTVGDGANGLSGGANNLLQIIGVAAGATGNGGFGSLGGETLANTYVANLITPAQTTPYAAILDMRDQVLGAGWQITSSAAGVAAGAGRVITPAAMQGYVKVGANLLVNAGQPDQEAVVVTGVTATTFTANFAQAHAAGFNISSQLPQDPLTITVGRGTAYPNPVFQADGSNLLIQVTDTATNLPVNFAYQTGFYLDQPIMNGNTQVITSLVLRGNDGNDTFDINGNLGLGAVTIVGGAGNNTVVYSDLADTQATTYQVTAAAAGGGAYATTTLTATTGASAQVINAMNFNTLAVDAGSGGNTVNVQSTNGNQSVIIIGGTAGDQVNVGSAANTLGAINGQVSVLEAKNLNINDQGTGAQFTYTLTGSTFDRNGVVDLHYLGCTTVNISGPAAAGATNETFNIQATTTNTVVNGGPGTEIFNVGSASNNSSVLDGIQGKLTVNGGPGTDTLNINDQGSSSAESYDVWSNYIGRTSGSGAWFSSVEQMVLNGGSGNNNVQAYSTATGTITTVHAGSGSTNNIYVGSTGNTTTAGVLNYIQGDLTLDAGTANASTNRRIYLNDHGLTPVPVYTVTANSVTRVGIAVIRFSNYSSIRWPAACGALGWIPPAGILFGTALGAGQLDATSTLPGTFSYTLVDGTTPANGAILSVGNAQTLIATFTPTDSTHYSPVIYEVPINVYLPAAVSSVIVNGGAPAYTDANGLSYNLAGQNSVVEQILVTFNEAVTLDSGAFSITNRASSVTVVSGAGPSTDAVTASFAVVPGSGNTQYIVTFSGAGTIAIPGGTGNVIEDGVYELNTLGSHVHANGFTAPADNHAIFWALYGSVVSADNTTSGGTSTVVVDNYDYSAFVAAYGSESDIPSGTPAYNVALDGDLNGFIDNFDYSEFHGNFGADWTFSATIGS